MSRIDILYAKEERIYRDCCNINNCSECPHCNGNANWDCDLTLVAKEIEQEEKGGVSDGKTD